jgi:hypothetical protein
MEETPAILATMFIDNHRRELLPVGSARFPEGWKND